MVVMRVNRHNPWDLRQMQSLPLEAKIFMSERRIEQWFDHWDGEVYVSFSGGKDSTVLADLVARFCKKYGWKMYMLFVNTGLEYPEIQKFVKQFAEWLRAEYGIDVLLDIVRPDMRFDEVIKTYGYPVISKEVSSTISGARNSIKKGVYSHRLCKLGVKREEYGGLYDSGEYDYEKTVEDSKFKQTKWRFLLDANFDSSSYCCDVMKKKPAANYEKQTGRKPIIATMAYESENRRNAWLKNGCNAFGAKRAKSTPMAFWTEQDILLYLKTEVQRKIDKMWEDSKSPYRTKRKNARKYLRKIGYLKKGYASVYGDIRVKPTADSGENQINIIDYLGCYEQEDTLETTGCNRTGCIFCMFGCHLEKEPNRFQRLKETHPRQYEYCINGGEMVDGKWQPSKEGLGLGKVLDYIGVKYD